MTALFLPPLVPIVRLCLSGAGIVSNINTWMASWFGICSFGTGTGIDVDVSGGIENTGTNDATEENDGNVKGGDRHGGSGGTVENASAADRKSGKEDEKIEMKRLKKRDGHGDLRRRHLG